MGQPTIDELTEKHDYDGENILIVVDEDDWHGICGPDVEHTSHGASPFEFEAVGETPPTDDVAKAFAERFDEKVSEVFSMVEGANEPLEEIRGMDIENMIGDR